MPLHANFIVSIVYLSDYVLLFAEYKNSMEAENQSLVLTFGSQLDQGLKDLHKTIIGSVSQQKQQLRCMEEHVRTHLASKSDVRKVLSFESFLHILPVNLM